MNIEHWYLSFPLLLLLMIYAGIRNQNKFLKEKEILEQYGFKIEQSVLRFDYHKIRLPSRKLMRGPLANPIRSIKNKNILIFTWQLRDFPDTRVFCLASAKEKVFPKFILRPEHIFDKFRQDIDFEENPEFSKKFFLTSKEHRGSREMVAEIFQDKSLQETLLKHEKPMNIESNGKEIFYYWLGKNVEAKDIPEVAAEIEELHNTYFDC